MNIQVFGTTKCFDTKKAQRYFKERGVKFQFIDLKQKGMSRGELTAVVRAVGGIDRLVDQECKDQEALALITYINADAKIDHLLENQQVIKTPVVRNGNKATVGYVPEIWVKWE
jgi:arsenate reductase-like glutaredoxin family protein